MRSSAMTNIGIANAAARLTMPRMPVQPITSICLLSGSDTRFHGAIANWTSRATGNTQIRRMAITATLTAVAYQAS